MGRTRTTHESAHDGVNALSGKSVCDKIYMVQLQLVAAYCNRSGHFIVVCALSSLDGDCIVLAEVRLDRFTKDLTGTDNNLCYPGPGPRRGRREISCESADCLSPSPGGIGSCSGGPGAR